VAEILELAKLIKYDEVAEGEIRACRVDAEFNASGRLPRRRSSSSVSPMRVSVLVRMVSIKLIEKEFRS